MYYMNNETTLFIELWHSVRDHLGSDDRISREILEKWFMSFEDFGFTKEELSGLLAEEKILQESFSDYYGEEEEYEDEDEDYNYDYED